MQRFRLENKYRYPANCYTNEELVGVYYRAFLEAFFARILHKKGMLLVMSTEIPPIVQVT